MISDYLLQAGRFLLLILIQILILNNIQINGYINPYLYILFILMMPFETPVAVMLFAGFILGLAIDMFLDTAGLHASASVLTAYLRKPVLRIFSPREGYDTSTFPSLHYLGFTWFAGYSAILVSIHHLAFFILEAFHFGELPRTLMRAGSSILLTLFVIFLYQMLMHKPGERKKG